MRVAGRANAAIGRGCARSVDAHQALPVATGPGFASFSYAARRLAGRRVAQASIGTSPCAQIVARVSRCTGNTHAFPGRGLLAQPCLAVLGATFVADRHHIGVADAAPRGVSVTLRSAALFVERTSGASRTAALGRQTLRGGEDLAFRCSQGRRASFDLAERPPSVRRGKAALAHGSLSCDAHVAAVSHGPGLRLTASKPAALRERQRIAPAGRPTGTGPARGARAGSACAPEGCDGRAAASPVQGRAPASGAASHDDGSNQEGSRDGLQGVPPFAFAVVCAQYRYLIMI
jgi:hypothetical protein